jgi:hypothetical protein
MSTTTFFLLRSPITRHGLAAVAGLAIPALSCAETVDWMRFYDGPAGGIDAAYAVAHVPGGGAAVTGRSSGAAGSASGWEYATVRYDAQGNVLWTARYAHPGTYQPVEQGALPTPPSGGG